ncbi:GntR family transcriptional regulator [Nonomuraea typhae]|uniref:GntR family transcriptional regulator n=1 Tax=Nonomuraea typhae TaxID=2603600 RepID=UPI0012FA0AE1|nr:GntR family transcriptional regulator [Nonomuraea typhae]
MKPNEPVLPSRQIADDLREEIASGQLPPGFKLPAVRVLAARYGVTQGPVLKALAALKAEGLVNAIHGSGVYVREAHPVRRLGPDRYARHHWQATTVEARVDGRADSPAVIQQGGQSQDVRLTEADERTAAALGIEVGAPVYERARVMTRDDTPTHTMTSYYRQADVEGTPLVDARPGIAGRSGGFQVLTDQGLPPHQITEDLAARMPTADEALLLELPAGEPVVELHRVTRTADGRPIEYARGIHAASRFAWSYTFEIPD